MISRGIKVKKDCLRAIVNNEIFLRKKMLPQSMKQRQLQQQQQKKVNIIFVRSKDKSFFRIFDTKVHHLAI